MQVSHSQESGGEANFSIKSLSIMIVDFDDNTGGLAPVFGVSQATYFVLFASLSTIRVSQDQDPCFGANFAIKSLLEGAGFLGADSPFDGLEL